MSEMNIYCPICKRSVAHWNGKTQITIEAKCKKCNKLVVFYPTTKETGIKPLPKATTASGKRFY